MLQIVTDSASDITLQEAEKLGIQIMPLTITFPDGECPQETEEDFKEFYRRLVSSPELPTTSQTPPELYLECFRAARAAGDDVLVLTLSGGLSGTYRSACTAKLLSEYDRIFVIDTHQAITSQRILVEHAVALREQGLSTEEIVTRMEALRDRVTVSGIVDTLTYLRKGGRIPSSLAIVGNALHIKPVIALQGSILLAIGKVMGRNAGKKMLWNRLEQHPPDPAFPMLFGYSSGKELTETFMEETLEKYDFSGMEIRLVPVGGVIGTHVGTDCVALAYVAKEEIH